MMKNPLKREYLNDFAKNAQGEYIYNGDSYRIESKRTKCCFILACLTFFAVVPAASAGFTTWGGMRDTFYVIIPFILEIACCFGIVWNVARLMTKADNVKEYLLSSVSKFIPAFTFAFSACLIVSSICIAVFTINAVDNENTFASVMLIVLKFVSLGFATALRRFFNSINFIKIEK